MVYSVLAFSLLFFSIQFAQAREMLFEGYYKILSGDQHIGFSVSRYEIDMKQKKFYSTQLTKISSGGVDIIESLDAISEADESMTPVSYKYTSLEGKQSKTIDAKFTKGKTAKDKIKMTGTMTQTGKKPIKIHNDLDSNVFLSTFLSYRMLKSPQGIQTKSAYEYTAIAEEDGSALKGTAAVLKEEKYKGFTAFKVENNFKKVLFLSYVTDKGEPLATIVKDAHLTSELVADKSEAIGTVGLPEAATKTLFGGLPSGEKNIVTQYFKNADKVQNPGTGGKQEGFPAGQGVHIKNQAPGKKEGP